MAEKSRHLSRGVWTDWVSVRSIAVPARPTMSGAVDDPLFRNDLAAGVAVDLAGVGPPVRHSPLTFRYRRCCHTRRDWPAGDPPLSQQVIRVSRMDGRITITMKEDQWYGAATDQLP